MTPTNRWRQAQILEAARVLPSIHDRAAFIRWAERADSEAAHPTADPKRGAVFVVGGNASADGDVMAHDDDAADTRRGNPTVTTPAAPAEELPEGEDDALRGVQRRSLAQRRQDFWNA